MLIVLELRISAEELFQALEFKSAPVSVNKNGNVKRLFTDDHEIVGLGTGGFKPERGGVNSATPLVAPYYKRINLFRR
jgi:hypothetical protein